MSWLLSGHDRRCQEVLAAAEHGAWTGEERKVLRCFARWTEAALQRHADALHRLLKARIPVLPPDCRHADYDVLPVMLSEGCLANCGFCRIKTSGGFRLRSSAEVEQQLLGLADLSGLSDEDFCRLSGLPFKLFINVGLESFDQQTLDMLRKPGRAEDNRDAFARITALNRQHPGLEISVNLVSGGTVGSGHLPAALAVLNKTVTGFDPCTTVYLSPLLGDFDRKTFLTDLRRLKSLLKVPVVPYLIQRL